MIFSIIINTAKEILLADGFSRPNVPTFQLQKRLPAKIILQGGRVSGSQEKDEEEEGEQQRRTSPCLFFSSSP
jgi:hypothetical protein